MSENGIDSANSKPASRQPASAVSNSAVARVSSVVTKSPGCAPRASPGRRSQR